jgi:hypothetical protein
VSILARLRSPVALILIATALSGGSGYLVTGIVARQIDEADYALFSFFWSALYLVVGASGGVQQEITRATTTTQSPDVAADAPAVRPARIRLFALVVAAALFALLAATGPLWAPALFGDGAGRFVVPLALGAASYILVAALCGSLYGIVAWRALSTMIAIDGVIRLAAVLVVLALGGDLGALAWAVVLPFPAAIAVVGPFVARSLTRDLRVDVGTRRLAWNVARTVLASAATASIISGFPVLLSATSVDDAPAALAPIVLALMLTRAPIVIPLLALQSYLIVDFRGHARTVLRRFAVIEAVVASVAVVATVLAVLVGPQLIVAVLGEKYDIAGWMLGVIVASSALVAGLCVSGPALIAQSRHSANVAGWVVAAVGTVVALALPIELYPRVALALLAGPLLGFAVHVGALVVGRRHAVPGPQPLG